MEHILHTLPRVLHLLFFGKPGEYRLIELRGYLFGVAVDHWFAGELQRLLFG